MITNATARSLAEHVEPVTRHIPLNLSRGGFLSRCKDLARLVIEALNESRLRSLLVTIGVPEADLKETRSVRLLDQIIQLARLSNQSGLSFVLEGTTLYGRLKELQDNGSPRLVPSLFVLNDLRQLDAHRAGSSEKQKFESALRAFALDAASFGAGWGLALDVVYDRIAEALETAAKTLSSVDSSR